MTIKFQSYAGQIFLCSFSWSIENEMKKLRPVVAITAPTTKLRQSKLCHIVPLSTTEPREIKKYHCKLTNMPLITDYFCQKECWAKCDMIFTVSYKRLDLPFKGRDVSGKRSYTPINVGKLNLDKIRTSVLEALQFKSDLKNSEIIIQ